MPLLPSLDPEDVWGDQLNDAIRALTRAPLSHTSITALTNVEEGTLVPCTTHGHILRWDGDSWEVWYAIDKGKIYSTDYGILLRVGTDTPVLIDTMFSSHNASAIKRQWASCEPAGFTPSGKRFFRFEYAVEIIFNSDMISDWSGETFSIDCILGLDAEFIDQRQVAEDSFDNNLYLHDIDNWPEHQGVVRLTDVSVPAVYYGFVEQALSPTDLHFYVMNSDSSGSPRVVEPNGRYNKVQYATPFTWAVGDILSFTGSFYGMYGTSF